MSTEPFQIGPHTDPLPAYKEWITPDGLPQYRVAVMKVPDSAPPAVREDAERTLAAFERQTSDDS